MELKKLVEEYKVKRDALNAIEARESEYADPDKFDEDWDEAYREEYIAWDKVVKELVNLLKIDTDTAKRMATTRLDDIVAIVDRTE